MIRGGSWNNNPRNVRSANRNNNLGFRLALPAHQWCGVSVAEQDRIRSSVKSGGKHEGGLIGVGSASWMAARKPRFVLLYQYFKGINDVIIHRNDNINRAA